METPIAINLPVSLKQEEDEMVIASCVLRSFEEEAYESPEEEEE